MHTMGDSISHGSALPNRERSMCPLCGNDELWEFYSQLGCPTQDGVLWSTKEEAIGAPVGDIRLEFCNTCTYIGNSAHEPEKVRFSGYDVSLQHSPLFQQFVHDLAHRLIDSYGIRAKHVLDIACGKGHFLKVICEMGGNRGTGIDPSCSSEQIVLDSGERLVFLKEFYGENHTSIQADLVSIRHMVDLLRDPKILLRQVRKSMEGRPNSILYIEVPAAGYTFGDLVVWNVVYEHRSWFTPESLRVLLEQTGFSVEHVALCWGDEYLGIEGRAIRSGAPVYPDESTVMVVRETLERFRQNRERILEDWGTTLTRLRASGKKVAAWGAGARAITFLNTYQIEDMVPVIVDINPRRQGLYLPRTGHQISPPDALKAFGPDVVLITNPTYELEIREQISGLGLSPEILVL